MTQPVSVVGLFCDDIREEKSGTTTIVGILPENMSVSDFPISLPKFGIYLRIHVDSSAPVGTISSKLVLTDGSEVKFEEIDEKLVPKAQEETKISGSPIVGVVTQVTKSPLVVSTPGRMNLIAKVGDEEFIAATLNIQKTESRS